MTIVHVLNVTLIGDDRQDTVGFALTHVWHRRLSSRCVRSAEVGNEVHNHLVVCSLIHGLDKLTKTTEA